MTKIRPTRPDDLAVIQRIELAAGELFRTIGMADIADHPVPTIDVLAEYQRAALSWVAVDHADRPVAFVLVQRVDGRAHIEQVSVHPDHARRRIGRDLIDHVERWAAGQGLPALTLTTFRDVQWNGPYYERLGFTVLAGSDRGPRLRTLMSEEAAHGLDPEHRIAMIRAIHDRQ
ncbi:GNAT family N-acetyltransferase [Actinoplanes auranticolor]|uniref:GCN5 family N-acetyltransferase n=1 Tax=Actinoplanes auranticolor TaxID=47988 RepID=A0A919SQN7_9ACTN|nr:GNAT family N-acetyltransferase [Actinoplanes auranticolor]GIM75078.1 GCN5 family N-acetyltransferase [Actinoplanes auranticolor]